MTLPAPGCNAESISRRLPAKALRFADWIAWASFSGSALLAYAASPAAAHVFGAGPDDATLFDTVINLPADQPSITGSVGNTTGAPTPTVQLNVADGGSVGKFFNAFSGSEVNISGGGVGDSFNALSGSEVNLSGGGVGDAFNVLPGSVANLSGGSVGFGFAAFSGSEVTLSGGSVGSSFTARSGSDVELIGGEYVLNGVPFTGSAITLSTNDIFTGTLSDGSTFIFSPARGDGLSGVTLTAAMLPEPITTPQIVTTDLSDRPSGLRAGQDLTLQASGTLGDHFAVVDATLNVQDGVVGLALEATRSTVNLSGGSIGDAFAAFSGSVVHISGGSVGNLFNALRGSVVNISGGSVGERFGGGSVVNISGGSVGERFAAGSLVNITGGSVGTGFIARSGSVVNISGGSVGERFVAFSGSEVNISGGSIGDTFAAASGSVVNLLGAEFFLDGLLLDELALGETLTISGRDVTLSGTLADGSPFSFDLNSTFPNSSEPIDDFFSPEATLTVTLVPEPSTLAVLLSGSVTLARRHRQS